MKSDDRLIAELLARARVIALVGASANPARDSHEVMAFLQSKGHRVIPVNPGLAGQTLLSERVFASLSDVDLPIDLVDVFRAPDAVPALVEEAIALKLPAMWTQLGVVHEAAAARAIAAGMAMVMDRCPKIEYRRLKLTPLGGV